MPQVRCENLGLGLAFLALGFPMPAGLKRYYGKGDLHFITFSCYRRLPLVGMCYANSGESADKSR